MEKVTVVSFVLYHPGTYTDDSSAYSCSLPSADPEPLLKAQKGVESFDPPDSSTATAAGVRFMVEGVAGSAPDSSVHKPVGGVVQVATTTEEEENVSGWFPAYCNDVPLVMYLNALSTACFHCLW